MIRFLASASSVLASVERKICVMLVALIALLILLNVATRALAVALSWVDELAVFAMVWMTFFGASLLLSERRHVSVTLLTNVLPGNRQRTFRLVSDSIVLLFVVGLFIMSLVWYDPVGLIQSRFDVSKLAESTFNFIYQEPTNTLGIPKFWVWLIVPITSTTMTVHASAAVASNFIPADHNQC